MSQKIVLASGNAKKVAELESMLGELKLTVIPQTQLGVSDAIASLVKMVLRLMSVHFMSLQKFQALKKMVRLSTVFLKITLPIAMA